MEFKQFRDELVKHFGTMVQDATALYSVALDKDELWEKYQTSFPEGTNEIYRERREHDCSSCKSFMRAMGNVVFIKNGEVTTLWDFVPTSPTYAVYHNIL